MHHALSPREHYNVWVRDKAPFMHLEHSTMFLTDTISTLHCHFSIAELHKGMWRVGDWVLVV